MCMDVNCVWKNTEQYDYPPHTHTRLVRTMPEQTGITYKNILPSLLECVFAPECFHSVFTQTVCPLQQRGPCTPKIRTNTCFCCDLYNCGRWVTYELNVRSLQQTGREISGMKLTGYSQIFLLHKTFSFLLILAVYLLPLTEKWQKKDQNLTWIIEKMVVNSHIGPCKMQNKKQNPCSTFY